MAPRASKPLGGSAATPIACARARRTWRCSWRPTPSPCAASGRVQLVAGNTRAFAVELGTGLCELFDAPDADPLTLGLIAQSLYAGLLMHGAFLDEVDTTVFETAYQLLAAATRVPAR